LVVETVIATGLALWLAIRLREPNVWLVVPIVLMLVRGHPLADYGLELRVTPPSLRAHLAIGLAAMALYAAGHATLAALHGGHLAWRLPHGLAVSLLHQLLSAALPEEFFFRGYVQSNLNRALGRPWSVAQARAGPGLVLQSGLFAICHVAAGGWVRLPVFFFGLLAGWLRDRSGSIVAPVVYHAIANVWAAVVI
jgi:hypothetical protein